MSTRHRLCLCCLVLAISLPTARAGADDPDLSAIELRRLFAPTSGERAAEQRGRIHIYEGLRDSDVERAMAEEFARIENMMFIRVIETEPDGAVKRDADTGAAVVRDDGC